MFLIGLTGLHRAGKSFFRDSGIPERHGYAVVNKKDLVTKLCKKSFAEEGRDFEQVVDRELLKQGFSLDCSQEDRAKVVWAVCNSWYGQQMKSQAVNITKQIVDTAREEYGDKVILDAVHNNLEWHIIHEYVPESALLLFDTPKHIRDSRPGEDSVQTVAAKNIRRMGFWNSDKSLPALPCLASWRIDGSQDIEQIGENFSVFVSCLENGVEPKKETPESLEAFIGKNITITDSRDQILQGLLAECAAVESQNITLQEKLVSDMAKDDAYCPTIEQ